MMNHLRNTVLCISIFFGLLFMGCASVPDAPQSKPTDISTFYGVWKGNWYREGNSGGATMDISPWGNNTVVIQGAYYGARSDSFRAIATLSDGELKVTQGTLVLKLNGKDSLLGSYGSGGEYRLTRN